ncbi:hypothetical protein [Acetobacter indonesiensis]|uniref:hypothetical protein n=1 Tax=Acetobacter indonesiensis TaxID=104101 RepID=UPI000A389482|nr:hypothetical protein [Acetobacter indonesiensis]
MIRQIVCGGVAVLALAGCTTNRTMIVQGNNPHSANGTHFVVEYSAKADASNELNNWVDLNPDCSVRGFYRISLLSGPTHGKASVQQAQVYPRYPKGSQVYACNMHPADGVKLVYQPAKGYRGLDVIKLQVSTPQGRFWTSNWYIQVQ